MLTRQPTSIVDLALEGTAVYLDVGKFIFPDSLSGFQENQREMEKFGDRGLLGEQRLWELEEKRKSRKSDSP